MPTLSRRDLFSAGAFVVAGAAASTMGGERMPAAADTPAGTRFAHGVASGDPLPDGVLIWTRVTPTRSDTPGSGLGADVAVTWEVAEDSGFLRVITRGTVVTGAGRDHTVKATPTGLRASTRYWYRFASGGVTSPVGRTKTAPAAGVPLDRLRLGVVSCANLQAGFFTAYRHLADRGDLDVVLHLGDYLYEYGVGEYQARDVVVRPHDPASEMTTLEHYRRRHAQYKTDLDLQALHAVVPFIVTWDDHESANDAWSGGAENHTEGAEGTWNARKEASKQAYAEWMPVRYEAGGQLYRRFGFGDLASVSMLDLRSYRSQQASTVVSADVSSPERTLTGAEQMDWLLDGFLRSDTQWKLVGNPVMIAPVRFPSTLSTAEIGGVQTLLGTTTIDGVPYNVDQWDGYTADRSRVISHLRDNAITDAVFLTGDIHSGWACEVPADPLTYPASGTSVATELVCTSVTSDNLDDILGIPPRTGSIAVEAAFRAANPHVKYLDFDSHGFSVLDVTPAAVTMKWYVLSERTSPTSTTALSTSFQVAAGTQKVTALR